MKDIYSPLEIDEEWDQRAPDMTGGETDGSTSVAVAPDPNGNAADTAPALEMSTDTSASTLPPESTPDTAAMMTDTAGEMPMTDPAHDVAEAVVEGHDSIAPAADTSVGEGTLQYHEMSAETPDATSVDTGSNEEVTSAKEAVDQPEVDAEPMRINVMGDDSGDAEGESSSVPEAGSVVEPQVKPEGMTDEVVTPEPKEEPEVAEEPELPASPVAEEEPNEEAGEDTGDASEVSTADMDSTDKRLMAAMDRWKEKKRQEVKDLTELRERVESDIAKMNDEITDLQARVTTKEGELDSIGQLLDEIGEIEEEKAA